LRADRTGSWSGNSIGFRTYVGGLPVAGFGVKYVSAMGGWRRFSTARFVQGADRFCAVALIRTGIRRSWWSGPAKLVLSVRAPGESLGLLGQLRCRALGISRRRFGKVSRDKRRGAIPPHWRWLEKWYSPELLRDDVGGCRKVVRVALPGSWRRICPGTSPAWASFCRCNPRDIGQGCGRDCPNLMRRRRLRQNSASALKARHRAACGPRGFQQAKERGGQACRGRIQPATKRTAGRRNRKTLNDALEDLGGSTDPAIRWAKQLEALRGRSKQRPRRESGCFERGRQYNRGHPGTERERILSVDRQH